MEALATRKINNGTEYNYLFPKAQLTEQTIKRNANVGHTVDFIPKVVKATKWQTEKIAAMLKGKTIYDTCKNIWHFVYQHIAYEKDENGYEQIRSPARAWHDRQHGVDCDCYTVFISSILSNLNIAHTLRITKYKEDYFQHIYPIVPMPDGSYITVDCVVNQFNYEEPYTQKQDTKMDLQFLNGVNDDDQFFNQASDSFQFEMKGFEDDEDQMGELGKWFNIKKPNKQTWQNIKTKTTNLLHDPHLIKNAVHLANRVNPYTTLLRNGVLASLKLNIFKVAQRLKWAYLSESEAAKRGVIPEHFIKLKKVLEKLEKIYFGAGGKPENMRKAILKGRGNRHKEIAVFGFGNIGMADVNSATSLQEVLGIELFEDENTAMLNGMGALGEPITASAAAAAITSASTIMGSIAAIIKSIGSIFPKKHEGEGAKDFDENELAKQDDVSTSDITDAVESADKERDDDYRSSDAKERTNDDAKPKDDKESFWEKNKTWIKPVGITVGGLTILGISYMVLKPKEKATAKPALNGVPKKHHHKHHQKKHTHKTAIALM